MVTAVKNLANGRSRLRMSSWIGMIQLMIRDTIRWNRGLSFDTFLFKTSFNFFKGIVDRRVNTTVAICDLSVSSSWWI
ncbi:unnamed protein product [Lactuca virosa]|uniref:Uncharacterized protein n=1 Tax=Lactuca virosa TaxID=75947 RepID=A0AAU9MQD4_9ASTR|nr:unnamed protein product [Lactuca virosa]